MKKAYFFINGFLLKENSTKNKDDVICLDNQYIYQIENFGVSKNFDTCVFGAIYDLLEDENEEPKIIPNSYVAIFEIDVSEKEYDSIYEICNIADFDILKTIKDNQNNLVYSVMFNDDKMPIENFIRAAQMKED